MNGRGYNKMALFKELKSFCASPFSSLQVRSVIKLTKLYFADNSINAKKTSLTDRPYCIALPKNNKVAGFGDIIKIAHRGKVHNAMIVTNTRPSKDLPVYDKWYIVLLNEKNEPAGTRISIPLPTKMRLRKDKFSKIIAMCNRFI